MPQRDERRPRDHFTTAEIALGCELSLRNVMYLCARGVIPAVSGGESQGKPRVFDYEGLARSALIGAFFMAGVEIFLASRLVQEIGNETSLHRLANLDAFLSHPHSGVVAIIRNDALDPEHAFYLHEALRKRSNNYRSSTAMEYDRLVEIFDRMYVFLNQYAPVEGGQGLTLSKYPIALYRIVGWRKGTESIQLDHAKPHGVGKLPDGWAEARENYRGMNRVNVSLAIRDALDKIANARGSR